jgi:uncharacterized protein
MGHPVVHFEVTGKDGAALQKFYGAAFGWSINTDNPMNYGMVNTGGAGGINGGISGGEHNHGVTFYIQADDPAATLAQVEKLGGKIVAPPMEVAGGVTIALFSDPEGHIVGLVNGM